MECISSRVPGRVGMLGNPSDAYGGCCISFLIDRFSAVATLKPNENGCISFKPSPLNHNGLEYDSIAALLISLATIEGYEGGVKLGVELLQAMTKKFAAFCEANEIKLHSRGFSLSFETSIPRQVGLSGSSAICTAAFNCLSTYFGIEIPMEDRPELIRSAETELGIIAGLQDRVVQVYGGIVFMDFSTQPHIYERLDPTVFNYLVGRLYIMFSEDPSNSGKIHSDVKRRWEMGDEDVRGGMVELADLARRGKDLLINKGNKTRDQESLKVLGGLMDQNFDIRRRLFGDLVLGERNLWMIEMARGLGAAAKMTGSGGCALILDLDDKASQLEQEAQVEGFTFLPVRLPDC